MIVGYPEDDGRLDCKNISVMAGLFKSYLCLLVKKSLRSIKEIEIMNQDFSPEVNTTTPLFCFIL